MDFYFFVFLFRVFYKYSVSAKCHLRTQGHLCTRRSARSYNVEPYVPHRHLRSTKKMLLREPAYNLHSYHHSFSVSALRLWNALPFELKCSPSVNSFKNWLKLSFSKGRFFKHWLSFSFILVFAMLFIFSVIILMVIILGLTLNYIINFS